jgi:uncharacterized repeat protein (TIGR01451 family)
MGVLIMIRRYVVWASVLGLVGLATWVQGQDRPTPANGESAEPVNRYQGLTQDVVDEYGSGETAPVVPNRLEPPSNLPSVLKKPQAVGTVPTLRDDNARVRPIPTAVAPKGSQPKRAETRLASPIQTPTPPHSVQATPGYARQVPSPSDGGQTTPQGNEQPLRLSVQSPQLELKAIGPDAVTIGKPARYQLTMSNLSNTGAESIMIRGMLPKTVEIARMEPSAGVAEKMPDEEGAISWQIEELKGRQTAVLTLTLIPTVAEPFSINVDWALRPKSLTAQIQVQQPALKIAIDGPEDVLFGTKQLFVIRVQNPGTGPARDVRLTLATGESAPHIKEMGTIGAGKEEIVKVELIARDAGSLEVLANATSEDLETATRKTVLVRQAALVVDVTGPPIKYANTDGVYRVVVSNEGNAPAQNVHTKVQLPVGCRLLAASNNGRENAGRVEWTIPTLNVGQKMTFDLSCLFEASGDQRIAATAEAGPLTSTDTFATRVEAIADLKMIVHDPRGPRPVGEEVTYTIEVTNRGTKSALNVKVSGFFSKGIEPLRFTGHDGETSDGGVVFTPIPRLDPGKTIKLAIVAKATTPGNMIFKSTVVCEDPETKLAAEDSTRYFGADILGGSQYRIGEDERSESR